MKLHKVSGKLTAAEIAEIDRLAVTLKNPTPAEVARRLNRNLGTISWHMMNKGYLERAIIYREHGALGYYVRGKQKIYYWSREMDRRLIDLRVEGLNPRQIAEQVTKDFGIPRNGHSVDVRLKMLAAFDGGPEDDAPRQALEEQRA